MKNLECFIGKTCVINTIAGGPMGRSQLIGIVESVDEKGVLISEKMKTWISMRQIITISEGKTSNLFEKKEEALASFEDEVKGKLVNLSAIEQLSKKYAARS